MELVLGVDVGTSGCKVVAVNPRTGVIVANGQRSYPTSYPRAGWAEQDPEDWYSAACGAIVDCLEAGDVKPQQVTCLSVTGPAHNVALMDQTGRVLFPVIHWSDLRSIEQADWLQQQHGRQIFETTYSRTNPSWTLAQLLWLQQKEPDVWKELRRFLVTKDYVRYRLTGEYLTDVYDAIGTQLYDVKAGEWSPFLNDLIGFNTDWLPPVARATQRAGVLGANPARETGLLAGTPVAVGSGDSVVEAFGLGVVEPGQGIVKLGTAANVNLVTGRPRPSHQSLTYSHIVDGRWFSITATNSGAATLRWFRDAFYRDEVARAESHGSSGYELIERLADSVPAGCEGLIFHPYLMGERSPYWDPELRGDYVGISARHQAGHFARATLEGIAYSLRDCYQLLESLGQPISELYLMGGGARSVLWSRILCDVLGCPLLKPQVQGAAFGAALLAGISEGVIAGWQDAIRLRASISETLQPDAETSGLYTQFFHVYQSVARLLADSNHRLVNLASRSPTPTSIQH